MQYPDTPQTPFTPRVTAEMTTNLGAEDALPLAQLEMLNVLVGESARKDTVQLSGAFAYSETSPSALGALMRLGGPALKLYLTLVLATRKPPHDLYRSTSASRFARLLGYDDASYDTPTSAGTRRMQRALTALAAADAKFITREKRPGRPDAIAVNHFGAANPPYITIPLDMWRRGWIVTLSPRALAVYLALRHACAGKENAPRHVPPFRRRGYGLSDDTWMRGVRELREVGLLEVTYGTPDDRDVVRRRRQLYQLDSLVLEMPARRAAPTSTADTDKS